jgi:glutathione S-transferase
MKLYDFKMAPNPQRVNMFVAEKGIDIPTVEINTRERAQFTDSFKAVNPVSQVPVLELDDGTCISESMAICRYLEELHPEPVLFGRDAKERALVEMWSRRAEFMGYLSAADMLRNSSPVFEDRGLPGVPGGVPQIAELVERGRNSMARFFAHFDDRLGDTQFVAGDAFSVADITTFVTIRFAGRVEVAPPAACANIARWLAEVESRPSASAV